MYIKLGFRNHCITVDTICFLPPPLDLPSQWQTWKQKSWGIGQLICLELHLFSFQCPFCIVPLYPSLLHRAIQTGWPSDDIIAGVDVCRHSFTTHGPLNHQWNVIPSGSPRWFMMTHLLGLPLLPPSAQWAIHSRQVKEDERGGTAVVDRLTGRWEVPCLLLERMMIHPCNSRLFFFSLACIMIGSDIVHRINSSSLSSLTILRTGDKILCLLSFQAVAGHRRQLPAMVCWGAWCDRR